MDEFSDKIYLHDRPGLGREGVVFMFIPPFIFENERYTARAIGIYDFDDGFRAYYWFVNDPRYLGGDGPFSPNDLNNYLRGIVPLPKHIDKSIYDVIWALLPQPIAEEFPPPEPFDVICGGPGTIKITRRECYVVLEYACDYELYGRQFTKRVVCVWAHGAIDVIRLATFEGPSAAPPAVFRGEVVPLEYDSLCAFIYAHPDWFCI